jgi:sec-independent protein translocase protein TatA
MPFNIGPGELILILVIALVVLGPGKLPDVASSLGKSVREFRKAATDVTEAGRLDDASSSTSSSPTAAQPARAPGSPTDPVDAPPAAPATVADPTGEPARTTAAAARDSDAS